MVTTPPAGLFDAEPFTGDLGTPVVVPGSKGNGKLIPSSPLPQSALEEAISDSGVEPQENGTSNHPFTTSRVDTTATNAISKLYPNSAAGKLYFKIGTASYVCSASLIKKGLIVTAAHCVADFKNHVFYSGWQFIPALWSTTKPFGTWNWAEARVIPSYKAGTDPCTVAGVVCKNDVAVITLAAQNGAYPGTNTGWFGYGVADGALQGLLPKPHLSIS